MNPYLRMQQPKRGTAYYYAKDINSLWPENPSALIEPAIKTKVVEEWPIGLSPASNESGRAVGTGALAVYLEDEYLTTVQMKRFLTTENHWFYWRNPRIDAQNRGEAITRENIHLGRGIGIEQIQSGVPMDGEPRVYRTVESGTIMIGPTTESWSGKEHQWFEMKGPKTLAQDLQHELTTAFNRWRPPVPTSLDNRVKSAFIDAMRQIATPREQKRNRPDILWIPCGNVQVYVVWALWEDKGFTKQPRFPLFNVGSWVTLGVGRQFHEPNADLLFASEDAIDTAAELCPPEDKLSAEEIENLKVRLESQVQDVIAIAVKDSNG